MGIKETIGKINNPQNATQEEITEALQATWLASVENRNYDACATILLSVGRAKASIWYLRGSIALSLLAVILSLAALVKSI